MDFNGEKELRRAIESKCCLIVAREAGWNIFGSLSLVMRSVFEGGAGDVSPGSEVRSIDSGDLDLFFDSPPGDEEGDPGGEACRPPV